MLVTSAALVQLRVGFSAAFNRGLGNVVTLADKIATTVPSSTASNLYGWLGGNSRLAEMDRRTGDPENI